MDWDDVRYFLALARTGSVRAAGSALSVSHSTVARRVEALEERLAVRLFDRSRDGYTLTGAGQQMVPRAERVEAEIATLERELLGQDERLEGPVSLTCCDNYVADIVLQDLRPFVAQHAGIELRFTTDSRSFDLSRREADIALRTLPRGQQPPEHLIGKRLVPMTVATYTADRSVDRWVAYSDRKAHLLLANGTAYADWPSWGAFSCLELMERAVESGLGIAMLPTYVGDRSDRLRRMPHADPRHVADLWLVSHVDLRDNARLRATRARISAALGARIDLFEGRCADATGGPENAPRSQDEPPVP